MTDMSFTDPDEAAENWADVRMTDPAEGEWDVDFVVGGGQVSYVDVRVRPELIAPFVNCLLDDLTDRVVADVLQDIADRQDVDLADVDDPE